MSEPIRQNSLYAVLKVHYRQTSAIWFVRQVIGAGSRAERLSLQDVLTRARAVLSDERLAVAAAAARGQVKRWNQPPARGHQLL